MSLRVRVALSGLAAVTLVLAGAGWWLSARVEADGRRGIDRELQGRAPKLVAPGLLPSQPASRQAGADEIVTAGSNRPLARTRTPTLLEGAGVFTLARRGADVSPAGDVPAGATTLHLPPGLHTRILAGKHWRLLAVNHANGDQLLLGQTLEPVLARVRTTRSLLVRLGIVALLATAVLGLGAGTLALRPLAALRRAAEGIGEPDRDQLAFAASGPPEVRALATALRLMLARVGESGAETERALEATRRFAGDAGHELRTPLAAMGADLAVLGDYATAAPPVVREAITSLNGAQQQLTARVQSLQLLTLGDAGRSLPRTEIDLADLAEESVRAARRRHAGRDVRLDPSAEVATIHGWPDGLCAIVDNLVENALRHAGPAAAVHVAVLATNEHILLHVDDNGRGIPPTDRGRIFERFARGRDAAPGGSGLGLSIVAQQTQLHDGTVTVGPSPFGGARFTVRLPRKH